MVWSECEWLSLLIALVAALVAVMSWLNNSNSNHNQQQPQQPQQQHAASSTAAIRSLARPAAITSARPTAATSLQPPSMDLSLPATPPTVSFDSPADENQFIATLLQSAHSSLAQQKPMQALSLVLAAVRQQRGEEGVFDVLNETREGFGLKAHANPIRQQREMQQRQIEIETAQMDADDGDLGMAALSLRSAGPVLLHQQMRRLQLASGGGGGYEDTEMEDDDEGEGEGDEKDDAKYGEEGDGSILDEAGRGGVVDLAVQAGRFVTCRACGGVISRERMQAHVQLWCEANELPQGHGDG